MQYVRKRHDAVKVQLRDYINCVCLDSGVAIQVFVTSCPWLYAPRIRNTSSALTATDSPRRPSKFERSPLRHTISFSGSVYGRNPRRFFVSYVLLPVNELFSWPDRESSPSPLAEQSQQTERAKPCHSLRHRLSDARGRMV